MPVMLKRIDWVIALRDFIRRQTRTNKKESKKFFDVDLFIRQRSLWIPLFLSKTREKFYTPQFPTARIFFNITMFVFSQWIIDVLFLN